MGKNEDFSAEDIRLDALVKSEYKKQAEEIIRHAEANVEDLPDDKEEEQRRFMLIMEAMREQGQLTEEEEKQVFGFVADKSADPGEPKFSGSFAAAVEKNAVRNGKKARFRFMRMGSWKSFRRSMGKWAAIVAITCTGMFTLSMTSQANRQYVADTVSYILGRDTRVSVNNDDGALIRGVTEAEARADIKSSLGVLIPVLKHKPVGLTFQGYELHDNSGYAVMNYNYKDNTFLLTILADDEKRTRSGIYDGKPSERIPLAQDDAIADFYESVDSDDISTCGAEWNYNNGYYRMNGKLEKKEFIEILKKISF